MKSFASRVLALMPLLFAASAYGQALPYLFESDGTGLPNKLYWRTEPGIRYDLWKSDNLADWQRVTGYPAVAEGLAMEHAFTPGPGGRGFFKMIPIDDQPPVVTNRFPEDGDFGIGRFAKLTIKLGDATGIDPASIQLTVGGRGTFQLGSAELTYVNGTLTFDGGGDTAIGTFGETVSVSLQIIDTLGNSGVQLWTFQLETQPQLAPGLFVFGSPEALRAGQQVGAIATRALIKGPVRMDAASDPWTLESVAVDRIVLAYTGAAAPVFPIGTTLCNRTPATLNEIFYRKVLSASDDPLTKKLTLMTADVGLEEIVVDGTLTTGAEGLAFAVGANGVIERAYETGDKNFPLGDLGYSMDGNTFQLTREDGLNMVSLDFEELHWWLHNCRFNTSIDIGLTKGLRRLDASFEGDLDSAMVFDASVALTGKALEKEFDIYPGDVPIWIIPVGPVGFVSINLDLKLKAEAEAAVLMNIHTGFRQGGRMDRLGFRYDSQDFSWSNDINLHPTQNEPFSGNVNGNLSLGVKLLPSVSFLVYGLAGAEFSLATGGKVVLAPNAQNVLSGRFEAGVDLSLTPGGRALEWLRPQPSLSRDLLTRSWHLFPNEPSAGEPVLAINSQPKNVTAAIDGQAGFYCTANRFSGVTWQWVHNNLPIPGETRDHLQIPSVEAYHQGEYFVLATAGGVTVESSVANLSVLNNYADLAEYFQYPVGDRAWKAEFPSHPSVWERNDLYPANPDGDTSVRADKVAASGWYNIQDVGSYNPDLTVPGIHPGEDWNKIGGDTGEAAYPVSRGTVVKISQTNSSSISQWGWTIVVAHRLADSLRKPGDADVYYSIYTHLSPRQDGSLVENTADKAQFPYKVGYSVSMNHPIGYIAAIPAGPHLHLEMRRKVREIGDSSQLYTPLSSNGYYPISSGVTSAFTTMQSEGIIDPSDFIDDHGAISSNPATDSFALIPAGSIQMGQDGIATPVHSVYVSGFYMGKYEVTKELWDTVRAWALNNGYTDLAVGNGGYAPKGPNHPVHSISWFDMVKWCNARSQKDGLTPCYTVSGSIYKTGTNSAVACNWSASGYRLPSEAEWEKAARGGVSGKLFPWGADTISHGQANYYSSTSYSYDVSPTRGYHPTYAVGFYPYSSPVGSFAQNGYRLYDIAGNMWEWCWDWYGSYMADSQSDPSGPGSGSYRVLRGGSWYSYADYCRVADHSYYDPADSNDNFGFRLARSSVP